jgi:hypothetical protein
MRAPAMWIAPVYILTYKKFGLGHRNAFIKSAMATCDHPSDLVHRIAYPSLGRPGLRIDSWRFQPWRRRRENGLLHLPAYEKRKRATYFAKV